MQLDEPTLKRIRDLGALGITERQIVSLIQSDEINGEELFAILTREGSESNLAYAKGRAMMDYNTNVELTRSAEKGDPEAIELLAQRKQVQEQSELRFELFGV